MGYTMGMGLLTKALEKRFSASNIGILKAVFRLHEEGSPLINTVRIHMPEETYQELMEKGWYEERLGERRQIDRREAERRDSDRRESDRRSGGERRTDDRRDS
jgi:hypothetical protein